MNKFITYKRDFQPLPQSLTSVCKAAAPLALSDGPVAVRVT